MDKGQWYVTGIFLGGILFGGLAYLFGATESEAFLMFIIGSFIGRYVGWKIGVSKGSKNIIECPLLAESSHSNS